MMPRLRDRPIGEKALVLGIAPALCGVVLMAVASTIAIYYRGRAATLQDVEAESAIVAENVSEALGFDDRQVATDTIRAFRYKDDVDTVCVFDNTGALFVAFSQTGEVCPSRVDPGVLDNHALVREQTVTLAGRAVGLVRVTGNLHRLTVWMRTQAAVLGVTLTLSLFLALGLTRLLQRSIVAPIEHLAETADRVSTSQDYRVRAARLTGDEVGRLVDSFNAMLSRIEQQSEAAASLLQREQEANQLKDQFLAAVSHELRTPLTAILGWAHIVRAMNPSPETLARGLESIERNAKAQARVVEDLLQISHLAAGKARVHFQTIDLRAIVDAAVDVVRPDAATKSLRLNVEMPAEPCLVAADPGRIEQILWNLLTNAVRFTPSGSIDVEVAAGESTIAVRVRDTGIGIAPDFLPQVFDRFRQADGSPSRKYGGLGLGLAIAKELADLHGGTLTAASPGPGAGSTFTLELPRPDQRSGPAAAADARGVEVHGADQPPR